MTAFVRQTVEWPLPASDRIDLVEAATAWPRPISPSIAPARILAGHPHHQVADCGRCGWSAGSSARVGPAAGDEVGVSAQQGSGRHQPQLAQRGVEQSA
jgi:hypothetical protein